MGQSEPATAPPRQGSESPGRKGRTSAAWSQWTEDSDGWTLEMLSRHPPPCSQNYRHLASPGWESRGRCYGSSQRQNLFRTMSIQNRFVLCKQAEMKSLQRSCVFAIHNPGVGGRELPEHKSQVWTGEWPFTPPPTSVGAGCTPAKQDLEATIGTCSVQMGYSGLQPWCWAVPTIPLGPWDQGRVYHQVLGFLMKTVAWVPPAEIRPGSTRWGLLGFCTKASKGESASSRNTRI